MIKSNPIELAKITSIGATTPVTFSLSTAISDYSYQMAKMETQETCVVISLTALTGSLPTLTFDVYETVDGHDFHVGTTGAMSSPDDRVIDSGGGTTASGATFTSTSMLRLLGKGTDMKVVVTPSAVTIATVAATINVILYDGA
jgi:hypothetical protein